MNEKFKTILDKTCGSEFDLFEQAFDETPARHNFSRRHRRRMDECFKYCNDPAAARERFERKPFWSGFGAKQAAAAAAGLVLGCGLILGGAKMVDTFSALSDVNKRYDELLKDGNYYLNGDSSVYFKAENGAITLCGDREVIMELFLNDKEVDQNDPESVKEWAEYSCDYFMTEMKYAIVETSGVDHVITDDGEELTYPLLKYGFVLDTDRCTEPWSSYIFMFNYRSLMFDGENTIRLVPLGDFVYAG